MPGFEIQTAVLEARAEAAAKVEGLQIERDFARGEAARYKRRHLLVTRALTWALVTLVPATIALSVVILWLVQQLGARQC